MGFVAIACLVVYHYGYIHNLVRDHNKLVLDIKDAKSLMFASIIYNPLVLIVLLLDKI